MKKLLLLLASAAAIFTACEGGFDNEENGGNPSTPKIELSQQSIEVEFEPAQHSVSVTSPYSWEATSKNDWIEIETASGIAGTKDLKFSVERNEEDQERKGTIVLKNTDYNLVAELYVTQKAFAPEITIEPESLTFAVEGGEQEVTITSNIEYEFSTEADWITIEKSEKGVKVTVPSYVEVENRTADIAISNEKYGIAKVVTVTQGAFVPEITIEPESLTFAVEGGEQEVTITSNFEYEWSTNADWLTIEKSEKGLKVTAPNYVEVENRTAEVAILSKKYGIAKVVTVTQGAFVPEITIEPESLTFAVEGGEQEVTITSNFEYEWSTNADWLTIEKSEKGLKVTAPNYVEVENRTADITISNEKYGISKTISATQNGLPAEYAIFYTSSNNKIVTPYKSDVFGANIVSNTYENGLGVITFDAPVTSIGIGAFSGCVSLTSVTIPDSVTSIGDYAFSYCSSLTSVTIPDSVTSIGESAFEGCTSLKSVTIPDSVTSIGKYAFYSCDSLISVTIGNNVTSIGNYAFYYCSSLTSVTIGNSVTRIGNDAFHGCTSLTSITIPNSVTSIGIGAFSGCTSLTSVTIPDSVTSIGEYTFYGCSSLKSVTIPDSVTSIGIGAVSCCTSLTSVTIPDSVTSIGIGAFYNCTSLTSITIPDSVTSIGDRAFYNCISLTSVTIPDSVTSIGNSAFYGCKNLTSVYCKATTPPTGGSYMFYYLSGGDKPIGCTIYVPRNSVNAYKAAKYWSDYAWDIEGYDF